VLEKPDVRHEAIVSFPERVMTAAEEVGTFLIPPSSIMALQHYEQDPFPLGHSSIGRRI